MIAAQFSYLPNDATPAEIIAARFDEDGSDVKFRRKPLRSLPDSFAIPVAHTYNELYQINGRRSANLYLLDVQDELAELGVPLAANDEDLNARAKDLSQRCARLRDTAPSEEAALHGIRYLLQERFNLHPALLNEPLQSIPVTVSVTVGGTVTGIDKKGMTVTGALNRLCDEYWWRRTLRNVYVRNVEGYAVSSGLVHRNGYIYVSDESYKFIQQQSQRNIRTLKNTFAVNESTGEEVSLYELAEKSQANPKLRRGELMVRIRGFEEASKDLGHDAMFYTITCPSRMHRYKSRVDAKGNIKTYLNKKYDKTTPREAQKYLSKLWAQIRAQLAREGIYIYGFRVVEPHHDGTPHWHLLLFVSPNQSNRLTEVLREYALKADPDERGAAEHRFKAEKIDPAKGSATGYIAKYIAKGLDGYGMDVDLYNEDAKQSAKRIAAWARTWGIRQYQQIGGPPVGIYREMRRLKKAELSPEMQAIWEAADKGDWKTFMALMGGPLGKRKEMPVQLAKVWSDKPNRYREPSGNQIIGIEYGTVIVPTRLEQWSITFKGKREVFKPTSLVQRTITGQSAAESPGDSASGVRGFLAPLEFC